jgi:hypothetical protein
MTMRKDVKSSLISALETDLDAYMSEHHFGRGKNSLLYKRVVAGSTQVIDISFEVHPKDTPTAVAALYPTMEVLVPSVDTVLEAMVGGAPGALRGYSDARSKQPIGFTSEKADPGRWYLRQLNDLPAVIEEVRAFLDRWTLPLLDIYATPEDIVAAEERGDRRVVRDRPQLIRVVAAALACGRRDYAKALLETHLGAPGARRMYKQVFDYVEHAA